MNLSIWLQYTLNKSLTITELNQSNMPYAMLKLKAKLKNTTG